MIQSQKPRKLPQSPKTRPRINQNAGKIPKTKVKPTPPPRKNKSSPKTLPDKNKQKMSEKILTPLGQSLLGEFKSRVSNMFKSNGDRKFETGKRLHKPKPFSEIIAESELEEQKQESLTVRQTIPSNVPSSGNKRRKFTYTQPRSFEQRKEPVKEVVVEEVRDERVLMKKPRLETVTNLNSVGLFAKIGLVIFYNQRESGKLDERIVKEEYRRNSLVLQRENALKNFLKESAKRNLEHAEHHEITIRIDPKFTMQDLQECIRSKLLTSYEIEIVHNDEILSKMGVDPIIIKMRLKKL